MDSGLSLCMNFFRIGPPFSCGRRAKKSFGGKEMFFYIIPQNLTLPRKNFRGKGKIFAE